MKMRTLVDIRRLAGRTARIGHRSLKRSQKAQNGTFSEFCGEEPCRRLGDPQMFQNTHPHLFDIAGSKDPFGNNTLRVLPGAEAPRLHGATLDKHDRSKAARSSGDSGAPWRVRY